MIDNESLIHAIQHNFPKNKSIVFVGMMGAGKSTVGRRLAFQLDMDFIDTDLEIENAAQLSISEIFAHYGEAHFREIERKIVTRLLTENKGIISVGGGAFMDEALRQHIHAHGISIWLHSDFETLMKRVHNQDHRPLLAQNDPEEVMRKLIETRYPIYQKSDISIENNDLALDKTINVVLSSVYNYLNTQPR
ncbi:MAG: shikimate kinase [Alphaproteobacteria bacterium]|jgi:shikimate kinase